MSQSEKDVVLRGHQFVVGAKKIQKALDGRHATIGEITRRILHLAKDPLTVVVMGEFSAGKSSFLNRVLGTEVLPVAILPKTATLTRLVYGDPDAVGRVEIDRQLGDGSATEVITHQAFADLQRAAKLHDIAVAQDLATIREVRVFLNDPLLTRLQLVDTPGFNHDQAMDDKTLGILDIADIVIWITDAMQPANQTEFEKLRLLEARGKRTWLVVNKADVNVADGTAWEESRQSLTAYFGETGFLDFFESSAVELISCRQTDDFWTGKFDQMKARLSNEVFSADLRLSVKLVGDEWARLGAALGDETARYRELERRCAALQALARVDALADACEDELTEALLPQVRELVDALVKHGQDGQLSSAQGIRSVNSFVMEYTSGGLIRAVGDLALAYDEFLTALQVSHLTDMVVLLDVVQGTLPREHADLGAEVGVVRDYYRLLREQLFDAVQRIGGYSLPALELTVDLLDHVGVQFKPFDWCFSLSIEADGVLSVEGSGPTLTLAVYRRLQLQTALARDFRRDLERIVRDPACLGPLKQLQDLCDGTGKRLASASDIWRSHETALDAD